MEEEGGESSRAWSGGAGRDGGEGGEGGYGPSTRRRCRAPRAPTGGRARLSRDCHGREGGAPHTRQGYALQRRVPASGARQEVRAGIRIPAASSERVAWLQGLQLRPDADPRRVRVGSRAGLEEAGSAPRIYGVRASRCRASRGRRRARRRPTRMGGTARARRTSRPSRLRRRSRRGA